MKSHMTRLSEDLVSFSPFPFPLGDSGAEELRVWLRSCWWCRVPSGDRG